MVRHSIPVRRCALMLATLALGGCAEPQNPTGPTGSIRPSLAVGDVIAVTNTSDHDAGSLRWAVEQSSGGEDIRIDPGLAGQTITLLTTLEIPHRVIIEGNGIVVSGDGNVRVLHVQEGATLVDMNIVNGKADVGAGILADRTLLLRNSTISGNTAAADAGIRADTATLINSTVANNTATGGGAAGIGYASTGSLVLNSSTVAHNPGGPGIGPFDAGATPRVALINSIVASNGGVNCASSAGVELLGKNLADDMSCATASSSMLIGDPILGELADNGGPTATLALDPLSPAVNQGSCTTFGIAEDQRHVARDAACDLGAFEVLPAMPPAEFSIGTEGSIITDPIPGTARIDGIATCTGDVRFDVVVTMAQVQRVRGVLRTLQAAVTEQVRCAPGGVPWAAVFQPSGDDAFEMGDAHVGIATVSAPGVTPSSASGDVRLSHRRN